MRRRARAGLAGAMFGAALSWLFPAIAQAAQFDLWFAGGASVHAAIMAECDLFNRSQHRDRVRCTNFGSYQTVLQRTAAAYRAGKQPALVEIYDIATMEMIESDAYLPAEEFLAARGQKISATDYPAAVRKYYSDDRGRLYAVPFDISTLLLYANDDLLARARISRVPRTWDEFGVALARLKRAGTKCPFAFRLDPGWWLEQASAVAGAPIATGNNGHDGLAASYVFAQGPDRAIMEALVGWQRDGRAILYGNSALGSPQRAFVSGECAMVLDSSGSAGAYDRFSRGRFSVSAHPLPSPAGRCRHGSLPGGAALWVLKGFNADTYRAVAAFLAFVRAPRQQAGFAHATGYLPLSAEARAQTIAGAPHSLSTQAILVAARSLDGGGGGTATGARLGFYARFRAAWLQEMQRIFAGEETLGRGMANTQNRGNVLLRRFQAIYGAQGAGE